VSELCVNDFDGADEDSYTSEDGSIKVKVTPSTYPKCERCWVRSKSVGESSLHPTVCKRCVDNI